MRGGQQDDAATGPMLGKGSELQRLYTMPVTMGHESGVNCMIMVEDRVYTGGRDSNLFCWRAVPGPSGGFELVQDSPPIGLGSNVTSLCYDPASKWLFVGLWNGDIQAYCREPVVQDRLSGHRRSIGSMLVHAGVLVSGSNDGSVRLWTLNPQTGRYQCHGQPLNNPTGAVTAMKMVGDGLWVAAQNGMTCFDLVSLQPKGTIPSTHQVTGLLDCDGFVIATLRNGDIKVYDGTGKETFVLPSRGEHTSNTAVELVMHPIIGKPVLLCGQQYGYITAYDLPDFKPRGSFVCKHNSDVKAILDAKSNGIFMTGGTHGDIVVWQWTNATSAPQQAASPFAAGHPGGAAPPQAASPFAAAPGACGGPGGGMPGMMMG